MKIKAEKPRRTKVPYFTEEVLFEFIVIYKFAQIQIVLVCWSVTWTVKYWSTTSPLWLFSEPYVFSQFYFKKSVSAEAKGFMLLANVWVIEMKSKCSSVDKDSCLQEKEIDSCSLIETTCRISDWQILSCPIVNKENKVFYKPHTLSEFKKKK